MTQCYGYRPDDNAVLPIDHIYATPCPSGLGCCIPGDICLEDNICHFTHSQSGGSFSGYYLGSCSDPTYTDSTCHKQCSSLLVPDVVYNNTSSNWACCASENGNPAAGFMGNVTCDTPSTLTFDAPAPNDLTTVISSTSTGSSTGSATGDIQPSSTSSVSSSSSPTMTSNAQTSFLAPGAIAGIVIGSVVGAGIVIAVIVVLVRRDLYRHYLLGRRNAAIASHSRPRPPVYEIEDTSRARRQELN